MNVSAVASCENHPTREAIGVCVRCRTRVCSECSTKVEGINYCVSCLAGLAVEGGRKLGARRARTKVSAPLQLALYWVLLSLALWSLLEVLLPGVG